MNDILEEFIMDKAYGNIYDLYDDSSDDKEEIIAAFEALVKAAKEAINKLK